MADAGLDGRKLACLIPAKPHLEDSLTARETLAFAADVAPGAAALRFALKSLGSAVATAHHAAAASANASAGPTTPAEGRKDASGTGVELPPRTRQRTASAVTAEAAADPALPTAVAITPQTDPAAAVQPPASASTSLSANFLKSTQQLVAAHGGSLVSLLLARLGLTAVADTRVRELSPSQVRVLAAGEALLTGPRILALDRHLDGMSPDEAAATMARWRDHARLAGSVVIIGAGAAPPAAAALAFADQVVAVASSDGVGSPAGIAYAGPAAGVAAYLAAPAPRGWGMPLASASNFNAVALMSAVVEAQEAQATTAAASAGVAAAGSKSKRGCCGKRAAADAAGATSSSQASEPALPRSLSAIVAAAAAAMSRHLSHAGALASGSDAAAAERAFRDLLAAGPSLTQRWDAAQATTAAETAATAEPTLPDGSSAVGTTAAASGTVAAVKPFEAPAATSTAPSWLSDPAVKARYGRGSAVPAAAVLLALFLRHMKVMRRTPLLWLPRLALSVGYGLYLGSLYFAPSPKMYTAKASLASYLCVILSAAVAFETRPFVRMAKVWHAMMDVHGWTSAKALIGVTSIAVGLPVSFFSSFLLSLPIYTMVDYAADSKARFLFFW